MLYSWILVQSHLSVQIQVVLCGERRVLRVKVWKAHKGAGHVRHASTFGVELSRGEGAPDGEHERDSGGEDEEHEDGEGPRIAQTRSSPPIVTRLDHGVPLDVVDRPAQLKHLLIARCHHYLGRRFGVPCSLCAPLPPPLGV